MTAISKESTPPSPPSPLEWVRKNFFKTWYNSLLTILGATVVYFALVNIATWMLRPQTGVRLQQHRCYIWWDSTHGRNCGAQASVC